MNKMMTAIAIATVLSVGILGAVTAAHAQTYSINASNYDGKPDWTSTQGGPRHTIR